jgi:hypothetical protein
MSAVTEEKVPRCFATLDAGKHDGAPKGPLWSKGQIPRAAAARGSVSQRTDLVIGHFPVE